MAQVITAGEVVTVHSGGVTVQGVVATGLADGGYAVAWAENIAGITWTRVARLDADDHLLDLDPATDGSFRILKSPTAWYGGSSASIDATADGGFVVEFWDNELENAVGRFDSSSFIGIDNLEDDEFFIAVGAVSVAGLSGGGYVVGYAGDDFPEDVYNGFATTFLSSVGSTQVAGPTTRTFVTEVGNGYVLAYSDSGQVKARIVSTTQAPIDIAVNQTTTAQTRIDGKTSAAELSNGNFVIVWSNGTNKVFARVFEPDGDAVTDEIWVDGNTTSDWPASVVALKGGGFAVLWSGGNAGIQVFDNAGTRVGDVFWDFGGGDDAVITGMTVLESGELLVTYEGGTRGFASVQKLSVGPTTVGAAPTDITGKLKWTEGTKGAVGTLHVTDADDTTGFVWSLLDDAGGRFKIDAATGKVSVAKPILLDYEQATTHAITVKVTDNDGNSFTKVLSAKGTDVAMEDLTLTAKADKVFGGAKVDVFEGGKGDDTIRGGGGKDEIDGGKGKDTADYSDKTNSVEVTLNGSKAVTVEVGGKAEDAIRNIENLVAGSKADHLTGDRASNSFHGGKGKDVLDGKGGKDFFVFDTTLGNKHVDTIEGFKAKDDTIVLDHTIFTALAAGPLSVDAFAANKTGEAADDSDRIIYEKDTGKLFYDADGNGAGARMLFAVLDGHPKVTAADFMIV